MSKLWIPEDPIYICLWQRDDDSYVVNAEGEYLCAESRRVGDPEVEHKMRLAARHYGIDGGKPVWKRGRKISKLEWELQMERLHSGLIPDEREAAIAAIERLQDERE